MLFVQHAQFLGISGYPGSVWEGIPIRNYFRLFTLPVFLRFISLPPVKDQDENKNRQQGEGVPDLPRNSGS
jgi:hypothetical protein